MEKFTKLVATAAPMMRHNVDTDAIITVDRLMVAPRARMGEYGFEVWRFLPDGSEDPDFELNRPGFRGAGILIAGRNFGCGSSREMAVWALLGMGFRCVIAPSFGDIFATNCVKNGMLAVVLAQDAVERLAGEAQSVAGAQAFTVDLQACTVSTPGGNLVSFSIADGDRETLLGGLDEVAKTLRLDADIEAFQIRDRAQRPWVYPGAAGTPMAPPTGGKDG